MRRILVVGAILLFGAIAQAQVPKVGWDYLDADMTTYGVVRFEVRYDTGPWNSVGVPLDTTPITGGKSYWVALVQGTGPHTVSVRACNAFLCGDPAGPLGFSKPAPTTNIRISTR